MNRKPADSPRQDPIDPRDYWPYQRFRDRIIPIDLEAVLTEAESFLRVLEKDVFDPDQAFNAFFRFVRSTNPAGWPFNDHLGPRWMAAWGQSVECASSGVEWVYQQSIAMCILGYTRTWNLEHIFGLNSPPEIDRDAIKPPNVLSIPLFRDALARLRETIGPAAPRPAIRIDRNDPDRRTFLVRDDPTPYRLTKAQASVVLALIGAFPESIGKTSLEEKAGVSNAHTILKTIRKNKAWDSVIEMPGKAWAGYSIAPK